MIRETKGLPLGGRQAHFLKLLLANPDGVSNSQARASLQASDSCVYHLVHHIMRKRTFPLKIKRIGGEDWYSLAV